MIKRIILLKNIPDEYLVMFKKYWQKPLIVIFVIIVLYTISALFTSASTHNTYGHILEILTTIIYVWLAIQSIRTVRDIIIKNSFRRCNNNFDAQRINTQVDILVRIAIIALVVIGIALVLITFPQIQKIGMSILASAGIVGVIVGFAAQKSLGSILSGVQIALTQPIKIGDEVVVAGETGIIEEINLTYVVMCTMDKRRLIIPINYFIENIFQNWTRNSSDLLGVIYIDLDYTAPVQKIRKALDLILKGTDLWDGKTKLLQVSNTKPQTVELRILVSALNSANAWDLRCYVREKLIEFLQDKYPYCLPRVRVELNKDFETKQ